MTSRRKLYKNEGAQIYALHRDDEHGVLVEHGGPKYMSIYYEGDPDIEYTWYGLTDDARFIRLVLVPTAGDNIVHEWKVAENLYLHGGGPGIYTVGDVFARYTTPAKPEEEPKVNEPLPGFFQLLYMEKSQLRKLCLRQDVLVTHENTRTQMAMMLAAPVPQEDHCPECAHGTTAMHASDCGMARCMATGGPRRGCDKTHDGYCGPSRWTGYAAGVLESYVYDVTPEEILSKGVWDEYEKVFVYSPDNAADVDETTIEPGPDDEVLKNSVNVLLSNLGKRAREVAVSDVSAQQLDQKIGIENNDDKESE